MHVISIEGGLPIQVSVDGGITPIWAADGLSMYTVVVEAKTALWTALGEGAEAGSNIEEIERAKGDRKVGDAAGGGFRVGLRC